MTLSLKNKDKGNAANEKQPGNPLFPVFLKLNHLHTVLIGAGNVGLEKLAAIVHNSPEAKVTVIAQAFLPEIHILAAEYKGIIVKQKTFTATDLDDANIVVAATNDAELNTYIRDSAHERQLLVNVADKPELCDFYLGAIVQKGDLKIAISTNGKSPTVAKRLKEVLNEGLPAEIDTTLQQLSQLRNSLNGDFAEKVKTLNEITAVLVGEKGIKDKSNSLS
jgi:siroheme synthase-like protein